MVLQLAHGDILELFERYRDSGLWNERQAQRFLATCCRSAAAVATLRSMLRYDAAAPVGRAPASGDLFARAARLIADETLVLVHHQIGDRLPGTGVPLHASTESILALPGYRSGGAHHVLRTRAWLDSDVDVCELHPEIARLVPDASAEKLDALLHSGELIPVWHTRDHYSGDSVSSEGSHRAPARSQAPPEPEEVADAATFSPNIDAALIAEGQREAARLGLPFCEECMKAALSGSR